MDWPLSALECLRSSSPARRRRVVNWVKAHVLFVFWFNCAQGGQEELGVNEGESALKYQ